MDMQVDAQLIKGERLKRAWSQEQLAQVAGLGIRTVQRIENGGNASLETVKALAAVLELPIEALLVGTPASPALSPRFSLFKPWPAFAAGCAFTSLTFGSIFLMQSVQAEVVAMDFAFSINGKELGKNRVSSEAGEEAVVQIDDGISIHFTPSITDKGDILLDLKIFKDGQPLAMPKLLTINGRQAALKVGDRDENGRFTGIEMEVTPTIE